MQRPFKLPSCLTNFSGEEKRALDKMLDGHVQQFVERCVEHAKKKAQSEGRELSTQQEADIPNSWKNWREKVGDVTVSTLRSRGDTGQPTVHLPGGEP